MLAQVEGILHVSCWVVLGLEKGIEVPERTLNDFAFDLSEAHFQEDLAHLFYKAPIRVYLSPVERD